MNELKLQVLSLFGATQGEWLAPKEAAKGLISPRRDLRGRILRDCGVLACSNGVPKVEEL